MLGKKKNKRNKDSIATKLKTPDPVIEKKARELPYRSLHDRARNTLQDRNAKWADEHELADYETTRYIDDTDPEVLKFIKYLGYDPETLEKAIITVEVGQIVKVESVGYVCQEKTQGSPMRYSHLE